MKIEQEKLKRAWTPDQLAEIWNFCQHDFGRFLRLLLWLDKLK